MRAEWILLAWNVCVWEVKTLSIILIYVCFLSSVLYNTDLGNIYQTRSGEKTITL